MRCCDPVITIRHRRGVNPMPRSARDMSGRYAAVPAERHVRMLLDLGTIRFMQPDRPGSGGDERPNGVDRWAVLVASNHNMWERTKSQGLPRWATWSASLMVVLGLVAGSLVCVASHSWLATGVLVGTFSIAVVPILNFADLDRRP